jgi:alkanesulfonate monooxygenase SsuD/methylene tetrahydromethanopterin reductase-like flavin-dependent oxidoreductase (luciferase family)
MVGRTARGRDPDPLRHGEHVLRWSEGRLHAADQADADGELVLAALGGDKAECVAMLEAWGAHADDLDVLALGPRSPADELAVTWELVDELRAAFGRRPGSAPMRPGPKRRPGAFRR